MDINNIAQLSTGMSNQLTDVEVSVAVANLAKNNAKAVGEAAIQLIEAVPKPQSSLGHNIDVKA